MTSACSIYESLSNLCANRRIIFLWLINILLSGSVISRHRHLHGLSGDNHWVISPLAVNVNSVLSARAGKATVCLYIISNILLLSSTYSSSNISKSGLKTRSHTKKNTILLSLLVYHQPLLTKTAQPVFLCFSHFSHL